MNLQASTILDTAALPNLVHRQSLGEDFTQVYQSRENSVEIAKELREQQRLSSEIAKLTHEKTQVESKIAPEPTKCENNQGLQLNNGDAKLKEDKVKLEAQIKELETKLTGLSKESDYDNSDQKAAVKVEIMRLSKEKTKIDSQLKHEPVKCEETPAGRAMKEGRNVNDVLKEDKTKLEKQIKDLQTKLSTSSQDPKFDSSDIKAEILRLTDEKTNIEEQINPKPVQCDKNNKPINNNDSLKANKTKLEQEIKGLEKQLDASKARTEQLRNNSTGNT